MKQKARGLGHSFICSDLRSNISEILVRTNAGNVACQRGHREVFRIFAHLSVVTECTILVQLIFFFSSKQCPRSPRSDKWLSLSSNCSQIPRRSTDSYGYKAATARKQLKSRKGGVCEKGDSQVCAVICRQKQREATGY